MSTAAEQLQALDAWVARHDFAGWDPYDALNSPLLKALSLGTRHGGIAWVQLVKRCPWNLRPLLGVPRGRNPKGIGLFLHSAALEHGHTGSPASRDRITALGDWLLANGNRRWGGLGWGYNFPWPGRSFYCPAGTPTVVGTAFIGQALLRAHAVTREARWLEGAREAARFIHRGLPESVRDRRGVCAAYTPLDRSRIANANLLGAALLLAVGTHDRDPDLLDAGAERLEYSLADQRPDGSWLYGEAANQAWIDSFHTGYNLLAIEQGWRLTGEPRWRGALERGLAFYRDHFLEPDGTVAYYHDRRGPLDPHAFAHALITLQTLKALDGRCADLHARVLGRLEALFRREDGSYSFWITPAGRRVDIPYMRWVQAWVHAALAYAVHGQGPFNGGEPVS